VLSQYLEALLLALAQRRDGFSARGLGLRHLRAFWAMGWPTAVQFTLEIGSFAMLSFLVASFGELDMAAHQIGMQVQHLAFMPALALGEAASVLSARAVGAGVPAMVRGIAQRALAIAAIHTGTCTLVLALWAAPIAALFTADPALSALTIRVLHVACFFMVADASNVIARCVLRGTGDVRAPAVVGICSAWLLTPPLTYLLGRVLAYGVLGGWLGMTCEIVLGAVLLWLRLLGAGARVARLAVAG
jgi:multidrug resistance protein, MATE family